MKLDAEAKYRKIFNEPHDLDSTFLKLMGLANDTNMFLVYNKGAREKGLVTEVEYQIMWAQQELSNMRDRGLPYTELEDLCAECLDVCQVILEKQITDRNSLPEFKAYEEKLYQRKRDLTARPEYARLYREFPSS